MAEWRGSCRIPWWSWARKARAEAFPAVIPNPNSEASFAPTIVDLLRQRAAYRPHDRAFTFLVDGEVEELNITYAELDRKARALGAWLLPYSRRMRRARAAAATPPA